MSEPGSDTVEPSTSDAATDSAIAIGVLVVTHGQVGAALIAAAERLVGALPKTVAVSVETGEPCDDIDARLAAAADALGTREVLCLVDLYGSTPARRCWEQRARGNVVVTGVNLAMLFKLATVDRSPSSSARAVGDELSASAQKSIRVLDGKGP